MKKVLLVTVAMIGLAIAASAQIKKGIILGGNLNDQRINVNTGNMYAGDRFKGYHAGIITEVNLGSNFYLQPQLVFSRKGATHLSSADSLATKLRLSYIELPVNIVYKVELLFGKLFAGTGGTIGYAVGGSAERGNVKTKIYEGPDKKWKRTDVSLNFIAGLELNNGLFASVKWQRGLMDIYKAEGTAIKNRSFSVSVGYLVNLK
ncbi:MAG: porin family protein [Ferruginibacter sp.]